MAVSENCVLIIIYVIAQIFTQTVFINVHDGSIIDASRVGKIRRNRTNNTTKYDIVDNSVNLVASTQIDFDA